MGEGQHGTVRRGRLRRWLARYGPAEVAGLLGAVLAAGAISRLEVPAATALAGAIGEALAFYAVVVVRDLRDRPAGQGVWPTLRHLCVEFVPAELLDTFAVRPVAMYLGPLLVGDLTLGVVAGKIAADLVFYSCAIAGHEWRRTRPARAAGPAEPAGSAWPVDAADPHAPAALDRRPHRTPYLLMDLDRVAAAYRRLAAALPVDAVHYAVKCNPDPRVLTTLHTLGCRFEVASYDELSRLAALGVDPADVLFSNPVKPAAQIRLAAAAGCWRYAADSAAELAKLAEHAPGSAVYVRMRARADRASAVPSEGKFGVPVGPAADLLRRAARLGLHPYGLTFHVGSQMTRPTAWARAIADAGAVARALTPDGIRLDLLDIGGGFPARYAGDAPTDLADYGRVIRRALAGLPYPMRVVAEPGRALVAEAGVLVAEVIGTAERAGRRWVHLDVGAFNGLMECLETGNALAYPLADSRRGPARSPGNLTGPSCDSQDSILFDVPLTAGLTAGDRVYLGTAGAYTTAYASRFNGFDVPEVHCVSRPEQPAASAQLRTPAPVPAPTAGLLS